MFGRFEVRNGLGVNGEFDVQESVLRTSGKEAYLIDVGANIGEWTAHALDRVLPRHAHIVACTVLLVEPSPQAAETLRDRFSDAGNCIVLETAVGASETLLPLVADGTSPLNRILNSSQEALTANIESETTSGDQSILVSTRPLSDLVEETLPPSVILDLVKIDAEGMDFAILEGARKLLATDRIRVVQFEYNHRWLDWGFCLADCFKMANALGLELMKVTPHGLIHFRSWHVELDRFFDSNFALVNPRITKLEHVLSGEFSSRNVLRVRERT